MQPRSTRRSIARRTAWLVLYAVLGVLAYVALDVVPPWLRYLQGADARWLRRLAAIGFLDGFLVAYAVALIVACGGTIVLACRRTRGPLLPLQARLLLLSLSVLVGVVALEAGAAAWQMWLHRGPRLSAALFHAKANGAEDNLGQGHTSLSGPSLPNQFARFTPKPIPRSAL